MDYRDHICSFCARAKCWASEREVSPQQIIFFVLVVSLLACLGRDITQSYVGLTQKKAHFPLPTMNELSFHCCVWPSPSSHTHFFLSGRQKFEFLFYAFIVLFVYAELFASFSVVFSVNRLNQIIKNSMNSQYFLSYQIRTEKL